MIFVTVGTKHFPFERLFQCLEKALIDGKFSDKIVAQVALNRCVPPAWSSFPFMPYNAIIAHMSKADIVIGHAGTATVLAALHCGKIPIVMPRRAEFRESVDNHQVEFAGRMQNEGKVLVAENEAELLAHIQRGAHRTAELRAQPVETGPQALIAYLNSITAL